jgi:peptidoglycan/LPS O-acetylase OafA/YrhL
VRANLTSAVISAVGGKTDMTLIARIGRKLTQSGCCAPSSGVPEIPFDLRRVSALLKLEVFGVGLVQLASPPGCGDQPEAASRWTYSRDINLEIEYLRAVAIILVVVHHAGQFLAWKPIAYFGGGTGVDLFFCISGFVICQSFQPFFDRNRRDGKWWRAVRAFWVRRIFRLVPSAWLWLLIAIGCSWALNNTGWFYSFEGNLRSAIFITTNTTNFAFASGTLGGNAQYWSLALEDQFYIVFPFFLFFFRGRWRPLVLIALIFVQAFPDRSLPDHPYLWNTRCDALMWGCLISIFCGSATYCKWEPKFARRRMVALSLNAVLIFLLINLPHGYHLVPNFRAESSEALVSAGLVFLASFDAGYVLPVSQPVRVALAWIGSRSYGIYLIHIAVFGFIQDMGFRAWHLIPEHAAEPWFRFVYALAALVMVPIVAELNFRFVETPLRRKGKQLAQRIMAGRPTTQQAAHDGYEQAAGVEAIQAR